MTKVFIVVPYDIHPKAIEVFSRKEDAEAHANASDKDVEEYIVDDPDSFELELRECYEAFIHSNDITNVVYGENLKIRINKNWKHKIKLDIYEHQKGTSWRLLVQSFVSRQHAKEILGKKLMEIVLSGASWASLKERFEKERL